MATEEECSCEDEVEVKPKQVVIVAKASTGAPKDSDAHHRSHEKGDNQQASQLEMADNLLPLGYRDACAHLLIPLNKCRVENFYLPWKCVDERHSYEKCEFELFLRRVRKMEELRGYRPSS
eukprot:TRINITY_DN4771_c0_g1_i2.p1 TRINITY_DN4771_c0_g1~~TRINITY_DN4771_c0_g1_i2.p1  ORF type:complete len:121 (+),score=18.06 TRINITY_DN4771_c0_g1_i2:198-560(+)